MSLAHPLAQQRQLPTTINGVIDLMDEMIAYFRSQNSRMAYFAVLYRHVTAEVRDRIQTGFFDDGPRMEKLDVGFANLYFRALQQHAAGEPLSKSWLFSFEAAGKWRLLILQHFLLGMNAHINLDLGIAATLCVPAEKLPELQSDFDRINIILGEMLDKMQDKISSVSPVLGLLDTFGKRTDEVIMNFSITKARREAWKFAQAVAALPESEQPAYIAQRDTNMEKLARRVENPGKLFSIVTFFIRIFETGDVGKVIDALS